MLLTISKRFEVSSSHRYYVDQWSEPENRKFFGPGPTGVHGHGHNYEIFVVFSGPVDPDTGMVINVTTIKKRVGKVLAERYDHKYLNLDTKPFDVLLPTPENIAVTLLNDIRDLFASESAQPVAVHVNESPHSEATAYRDGRVERHYWLEFSAARRTWSPHLTEAQNSDLFGVAANPTGHGHGYRCRVTVAGTVDPIHGMIVPDKDSTAALRSLYDLVDHKNLNTDVGELAGMPMTTECLVRFMYHRLRVDLPVERVRLHENSYFFTECGSGEAISMGLETSFHAAHRLHSPKLPDEKNLEIYGKCNNPAGHGHLYRLETTIGGKLDEHSGTLYPLDRALESIEDVVRPWKYKHLDLDTGDFTDKPSTAENMISVLYNRLNEPFGERLNRVRLWETPNNRFTIRRD